MTVNVALNPNKSVILRGGVNMRKYQYHVYNDHMSFIVTVPVDDEHKYAEGFAKRVAMDFYEYTEDQVKDVRVERVVEFMMESAINLKKLNSL